MDTMKLMMQLTNSAVRVSMSTEMRIALSATGIR